MSALLELESYVIGIANLFWLQEVTSRATRRIKMRQAAGLAQARELSRVRSKSLARSALDAQGSPRCSVPRART